MIDESQIAKLTTHEARSSIVVNSFLFAAKLWVGLSLGSISFISDAIHSLSDSMSSIILLVSVRVGLQPPDKTHPFGHGRTDLIASLLMATLLAYTAFELGLSAFSRLESPTMQVPSHWALVVVALSVVGKAWLIYLAHTVAGATGSTAMVAEKWHHASDLASSLLILLPVLFNPATFPSIDGVVGLVIAALIFGTAMWIGKESASSLLGQGASQLEINEFEAVCQSVPGVRGTHLVRVHVYGHRRYATVHIELESSQSLLEAHTIAQSVESALADTGYTDAVVHMDPVSENTK